MSRFNCAKLAVLGLAVLGLLVTSTAIAQRTGSAERDDRTLDRAAVAVDSLKKDLRDARITLHPGLVDAENFVEALKVFPFDSSRQAVMEAVRKK